MSARPAIGAALALLAAGVVVLAAPDEGERGRATTGEPPYAARVLQVRDGDSLLVEAGGAQIEIRVFGIDAPERGQPWSRHARSALEALVGAGALRVIPRDRDAYGRTVAELEVGGACVACALVRDGHVWVYRRYTDDPRLRALEAEARAAGRGLWGLAAAERMPPWEWRHGRGGAVARETDTPEDASPEFVCGEKRRCSEMRSCAEARFQLRCGVPTLDGDHDGEPCEALCRREAQAVAE